jgi:hypothetical protein
MRVVAGAAFALTLAVAASGCSASSSPPKRGAAPAPTSTSPAATPTSTTTAPPVSTAPPTALTTSTPYAIEPCGGITTSVDLHPSVDNRALLLTPADGPPDYSYGAAQVAGGPTVVASVPSLAPAVYQSFHVPATDGGWGGQEVIGQVDAPGSATELAQQVESNIHSCEGGDQMALPGLPGVVADTYQFGLSRSQGSSSDATITVAEGSYIVSLQWNNSNTCSTYAGGPCPPPPTAPPPMPSASEMTQLVQQALAKIG